MININKGHSSRIMNACEPLRDYSWFVARGQELEAEADLETAIDQAIEEMPETFVIKRRLEAHKSEVKEMLTAEYNEKKQVELFFEDGRQEGIKEGENQLAKLMHALFDAKRDKDAVRAASDPEYRQKLYKEFQLA